MREYGFSLIRIHPYKDKIVDFVFIRENTGQWKPVFLDVLCNVMQNRTKQKPEISPNILEHNYC